MKRVFIILLLGLLSFSFVKRKGYSVYGTFSRGLNIKLTLYDDSTFLLNNSGCMHAYSAKGDWTISQDTLSLKYLKIKTKRGANDRWLETFSKFSVQNKDSIYNVCNPEHFAYSGRLLKLLKENH